MPSPTSFDIPAGFRAIASPACFAAAVSEGNWRLARHLHFIDRAVVETLRGSGPSILIVEAPPRHGKSELISKYLPAWFLGAFPGKRVMLAAYGAGFARSWGRRAREVLEEFGPSLFGVKVRRSLRAAAEWGLEGFEGGMLTAGIGGPLTGRGADLLIIDDPVKNSQQAKSARIRNSHWDWWQSTASTRIEPGGCAILIATRWNEDDLSGRLIREFDQGNGLAVRRVRLPALAEEGDPLGRLPGDALWPERWPKEHLEEKRRAISREWWLALFQQQPGCGSEFSLSRDYFGPELWAQRWPDAFEASVLAIDPSMGKETGDPSAIVFAGISGGLYWIDASIAHRPPEQMVAAAIVMADLHRPDLIVMETNSFQALLLGEFARQYQAAGRATRHVQSLYNGDNKAIRIGGLWSYLHPHLLRIRDTPDGRELVRQMREHPQCDHDDGPDALETALRTLRNNRLAPPVFDIDLEFAQA